MLAHQALEMLKRRTGLTNAQWVGLIALWYDIRIGEPSPVLRQVLRCRVGL
jgi:hypothetical protein